MYDIVVIGSGPGGLSAAARCAELGVSHVLLEGAQHISNTIQKYQKGKPVMATPDILPLRSPIGFVKAKREEVLETWETGIADLKVNIQHGSEANSISGEEGDFTIGLIAGEEVQGKHIILGIGTQGNPRQLGVPGDQEPWVQYQLDDPAEYTDETIAIVGAGDAAIENAIALSFNNNVIIINRKDEFARAKEGNLNDILAAIDSEQIQCYYSTTPSSIELTEGGETPGVFVLNTSTGEARVPVHRIIARLGSIPPRRLVESFGIEFPNKSLTTKVW